MFTFLVRTFGRFIDHAELRPAVRCTFLREKLGRSMCDGPFHFPAPTEASSSALGAARCRNTDTTQISPTTISISISKRMALTSTVASTSGHWN
jgi:hypothetical protein